MKKLDSSVCELARRDFGTYIAGFSPKFQRPPHVRLLIEKFEAVAAGRIRRLLISMPPRHGKTETISVHGPAWFLGREPESSVIFATHTAEFAEDIGRRVRNTLLTPLHQTIFPRSRVTPDSSAASKLALVAGGNYFAVGRGGALTGRGADLLILDDLLKDRDDAASPTIRRQLKDWFTTTAFTRLAPDGRAIVIGTRWHQDDLIGWLQTEHRDQGWEVLSLPALAEPGDPLGRAEGEALWPEKWSEASLAQTRAQMGSAAFAALFQGRPAALEGEIFKREWFRYYREAPALRAIVISLDTAFKAKASADYSVAQVWGVADAGYYLLDQFRARVEFPELQRVAEQLHAKWKARAVLVEDKASGQSLIQALQRSTRLPVIPVKVSTDKESRAHATTPLFEAGRVFLPEAARWIHDFTEELSTFPAASHDDQVDSLTQALSYLSRSSIGPVRIQAFPREAMRADVFEGSPGAHGGCHAGCEEDDEAPTAASRRDVYADY